MCCDRVGFQFFRSVVELEQRGIDDAHVVMRQHRSAKLAQQPWGGDESSAGKPSSWRARCSGCKWSPVPHSRHRRHGPEFEDQPCTMVVEREDERVKGLIWCWPAPAACKIYICLQADASLLHAICVRGKAVTSSSAVEEFAVKPSGATAVLRPVARGNRAPVSAQIASAIGAPAASGRGSGDQRCLQAEGAGRPILAG
ncbi:hypothetical protein FHY13_003290 [Xanthomonas arboricola]|nr:hypothetical protein [Xanthomonas euroxanthea]